MKVSSIERELSEESLALLSSSAKVDQPVDEEESVVSIHTGAGAAAGESERTGGTIAHVTAGAGAAAGAGT